MKKVFDFVVRSRFWEYFYLGFLSFVFFTGVTSSLVPKENMVFLLWLSEYKEDFIIILGRILLLRQFLIFMISLIKNRGIFKDNYKELLRIIAIFIVVYLIYYGTKRKIYAAYALLVMEGFETSFDRVIKSYVYAKGAGIVIWILTYMFGALRIIDYGRGYTFGMSHYNDAAFTICFFLIALWYLYGQKKIVTFTFVFLSAAVFCYWPINSRTAMLTMLLMVLFIWLIKPLFQNKKVSVVLKPLFTLFPVIMMATAILIGIYIYLNGFLFDGNMSIRFIEIAYAFVEDGLHLAVNPDAHIFEAHIFDNTYANFIYKRGLIFSILSMLEFVLCNGKIFRNNDYGLIAISLYLFIYGQMEYVVKGELLLVFAIYYFCKTIKKEETD